MKVFKSKNPTDTSIYYFSGEEDINTPDGLVESALVFHVQKVDDANESDYTVKDRMGESLHYKFSSREGLEEFESLGKQTFKTSDPLAVTSPSCLIAIGYKDPLVKLDVENDDDDEPTPITLEENEPEEPIE